MFDGFISMHSVSNLTGVFNNFTKYLFMLKVDHAFLMAAQRNGHAAPFVPYRHDLGASVCIGKIVNEP